MSIIFPDQSTMAIEDLIVFKKELTELLYNDSYDINDFNKIKEIIHRLEGYLLMADKKKLFNYFDSFYDLGLLNILNSYLNKNIPQISFSILECIYILLTNIQNTGLIFYLYSTKYQTYIPGEHLNIIDKIISIDAKKREEFLTYQVNFIKSLTLKLNIDCIDFFFDKNKNQFPILNKAFSLYNNKDAMIRSVVKNIFLTILKIKDDALRRFITAFPNNIYYPNIIFQLRNIVMKLSLVNFFDNSEKNSFDKFRDEHDNLIDHMYYIGDLLLIGVENVNFILMNCILNEIILPLVKIIISKKEEKVSIIFSLYILILFIHIVKNKFINDVISYLLFEDNILKKLLEKIEEFEFKSINTNLMNNINLLIVNNQYADVNDSEWKYISNYMADVTGVDLSTGFIKKDNIYSMIYNIIYNKNTNKNLLVKNEILINIKMLFTAKDDSFLLILNLLIKSEFDFYLNKDNINNEDKNKKLNIIKENNKNIENNNNLIGNAIDYQKNNNQKNKLDIIYNEKKIDNKNIINDELIELIKNDLFDDDEEEKEIDEIYKEEKGNLEKNNIINNKIDLNNMHKEEEYKYKYILFKNNFFKIIISDTTNLFNLLLKVIEMPKNFRLITNEIILSNITLLLNNNKDDENKKSIIYKISGIFRNEIQKLKNLINKDKKEKVSALVNTYRVFEQYVNPIDKKVNDLITCPFILIPLIYLDMEEDTPEYLKEDKFGNQTSKIFILKIFFLYDILNNLLGFENSMIIKTKKFPLELPKSKYQLGREYSDKDLNEEHFLYEIIINNKIIKSVIFFDFECIYFGHILSNTYKDLSKIKVIKRYKLRNIVIKIPENNEEDNTLLEIYDNSEARKNKNYIVINCFKADKTLGMFNYLRQKRINTLQLEYSLFESFIQSIERKISVR